VHRIFFYPEEYTARRDKAMQDTYICRTDLGEIEVGRNILTELILEAVSEMDGLVLVSNKKGKLQSMNSRFGGDAADRIEIDSEGDGLVILLNVVMRFGHSMQQLSDQLSGKISKRLRKVTGDAPLSVILHVTGTLSKRIAPRDLTYRTDYEY
jgi:uncharacterized alkaline shock family protein YloU